MKQVAIFLGMVNYYQEFVPNMATLAEPLRRLQRKGVKFVWSQSCQSAFDKLKAAVSRGVKVFIFDPNAPTYVSVDASDVGVGAVLSQMQNGREVPIAHASHTLQERERAYAVNEKEALACVWACETWEKFLLGRSFVLRTDHASLVSLLQSTTDTRKSAKFSRWLERLSEYDYKVEYRQGSQNAVADALSRLSVPTTGDAVADPTHDAIVRTLTSGQRVTSRHQRCHAGRLNVVNSHPLHHPRLAKKGHFPWPNSLRPRQRRADISKWISAAR